MEGLDINSRFLCVSLEKVNRRADRADDGDHRQHLLAAKYEKRVREQSYCTARATSFTREHLDGAAHDVHLFSARRRLSELQAGCKLRNDTDVAYLIHERLMRFGCV